MLCGVDFDGAGFLHSKEIIQLNENGLTKVQKTTNAALNKLHHNAGKAHSPEHSFLSKFFINRDQIRHLIYSYGYRGSTAESQDIVWWLNVGPEDVSFFNQSGKEIDDDILRKKLAKLFPKKHLLKDNELKAFKDSIYSDYRVPVQQVSRKSSECLNVLHSAEYKQITSSIKKLLKKDALLHLREKLHQRKRNDYQLLKLEHRVIKEDRNREWKSFDFNKFLKPFGIYILSSNVGTGKTCFLSHLQLKLLDETDFIPIFLDASKIEEWKPKNLSDFTKNLAEEVCPQQQQYHVESFFADAFSNNQVVLLVDGLDQIRGGEYQELVEDTILKLMGGNVIIASRPSAVINLEDSIKFTLLRVEPFDIKAQKQYFREHYERAYELCGNNPDLISIPMLAYMLRTLIEEKEDKNIKNRAQLYKKFIDFVLIRYKHGKARLKPDLRTQLRQSLTSLSWHALAEEKPFIQKVPLKFCYDKSCLPNDPKGRKAECLTKSGLVNLIIEQSGENKDYDYLYFTHQSFQEYLVAEYIAQNNGRIQQVLDEKWNPKWKEVIKFLAGFKGEEFIRRIYSPGCQDNCIHSRLFLAAECSAELAKPAEVEETVFSTLFELIAMPPFEEDAIIAMSLLNIKGPVDFLFSLAMEKDERISGPRKHLVKVRAIEAIPMLASKMTADQKFEFLRLAITSEYPLLDVFRGPIKYLIEIGALEPEDFNRIIEFICLNSINTSGRGYLMSTIHDRITSVNADKAFQFFGSKKESVKNEASQIIQGFAEANKLDDKHVLYVFDLLKTGTLKSKNHASDILKRLGRSNEILDKYVPEVVEILQNSCCDVKRLAAEILDVWLDKYSSQGQLCKFTPEQEEKIVSLIQDINPEIKKIGLNILSKIFEKRTLKYLPQILELLNNSSSDIQLAALNAIQKVSCQCTRRQTYCFIEPHLNQIYSLLKRKDKKICKVAFDIVQFYRKELPKEHFREIKDSLIRSKKEISKVPAETKLSASQIAKLQLLLASPNETDKKSALHILQHCSKRELNKQVNGILELVLENKLGLSEHAIYLLFRTAASISSKQMDILIKSLNSQYVDVAIAAFHVISRGCINRLNSKHTAKLIEFVEGEWRPASFLGAILLLDRPNSLPDYFLPKILRLLGKQDRFVREIIIILRNVVSDSEGDILELSEVDLIENTVQMSGLMIRKSVLGTFRKTLKDFSEDKIHKAASLFDTINFSDVFIYNKLIGFVPIVIKRLGDEGVKSILKMFADNPCSNILDMSIMMIPFNYLRQYPNIFKELLKHNDNEAKIKGLSILSKLPIELQPYEIDTVAKLMEDPKLYIREYAFTLLKKIYKQEICVDRVYSAYYQGYSHLVQTYSIPLDFLF